MHLSATCSGEALLMAWRMGVGSGGGVPAPLQSSLVKNHANTELVGLGRQSLHLLIWPESFPESRVAVAQVIWPTFLIWTFHFLSLSLLFLLTDGPWSFSPWSGLGLISLDLLCSFSALWQWKAHQNSFGGRILLGECVEDDSSVCKMPWHFLGIVTHHPLSNTNRSFVLKYLPYLHVGFTWTSRQLSSCETARWLQPWLTSIFPGLTCSGHSGSSLMRFALDRFIGQTYPIEGSIALTYGDSCDPWGSRLAKTTTTSRKTNLKYTTDALFFCGTKNK